MPLHEIKDLGRGEKYLHHKQRYVVVGALHIVHTRTVQPTATSNGGHVRATGWIKGTRELRFFSFNSSREVNSCGSGMGCGRDTGAS